MMITQKTRILIGVGLLIVAIGMGYILYRVFFSSNPFGQPIVPDPTNTPINGQFPQSDNAGVRGTNNSGQNQAPPSNIGNPILPPNQFDTTLPVPNIDENSPEIRLRTQAQAESINQTNAGLQYYNASDGLFYTLDTTGDATLLSDDVFYNVDTVTWNNTGDVAVIEYPDGSNIIYNFNTKKQKTLPRHWEDFDFTNNGSNIIAKSIGISEENRWLVSVESSGDNITLIEPLGENADRVIVSASPNNQVIAFSRTGNAVGQDSEEILLVGKQQENYKSLIVEGRGFEPVWSPSGNMLVYSVFSARSDYKPELWAVSAAGSSIGSNRRLLNVNTWADKCTFGNNDTTLYCAVPGTLERGAGFAPELADGTADLVYQIDVTTGARTLVNMGDTLNVIDQLFVSEDAEQLYFTQRSRTGIYEVAL